VQIAVKLNASCIANITNGRLSAQVRYTETVTCFVGRGLWVLCPRCSRGPACWRFEYQNRLEPDDDE
jgi:hypothetical protein